MAWYSKLLANLRRFGPIILQAIKMKKAQDAAKDAKKPPA